MTQDDDARRGLVTRGVASPAEVGALRLADGEGVGGSQLAHVALPLGNGHEDVGDQFAVGRGHIEVEVERDDRPAAIEGDLQEGAEVRNRPGQAFEPHDCEGVGVAAPQEIEDLRAAQTSAKRFGPRARVLQEGQRPSASVGSAEELLPNCHMHGRRLVQLPIRRLRRLRPLQPPRPDRAELTAETIVVPPSIEWTKAKKRWQRHLHVDVKGAFPEDFGASSWEPKTVETELKKDDVIDWFRNPAPKEDEVRVERDVPRSFPSREAQ